MGFNSELKGLRAVWVNTAIFPLRVTLYWAQEKKVQRMVGACFIIFLSPVAYVNQPKYLAKSDPWLSRLTFMQEEWLDPMRSVGKYGVHFIDR